MGQTKLVMSMRVCVITYLASPYQVELFNEIAARGEIRLQVIYLHHRHDLHPWGPVEIRHEHLILDGLVTARRAFKWVSRAELAVCNYYTHWFALAALHLRHLGGRPWVFWGERPGFLRMGLLGKVGRKLLLNPIAKSAAPIWAIGRSGVAGYRKDWGDDKVYVNLPYFSDLARFQQTSRATPGRECRVLYSGVLNVRKGVLELAEGFKEAALEHPHLRLIILGSGPLEKKMRQILEPVADRVSWEGFHEWQDLPGFYALADVLCLPTRHDGWAMVIPEALAAGLPVLTTGAAGAAVELIKHGLNGWLMPSADAAEITSFLGHIASLPPDEMTARSVAARESVSTHTLRGGGQRFVNASWEALAAFQCRFHDLGPPPRHILLTGTYQPDRLRSMARYVHLLETAPLAFAVRVERVAPPVFFGGLSQISARLGKLAAYLDKYLLFPLLLRRRALRLTSEGGCIVHVSDQGLGPIIPWIAGVPVVVTVHDLIAVRTAVGDIPELSRAGWRGLFQRYILWSLRLPSTVVCVSEKTLADCRRLIGDRHDYHVVYNPLDPEFHKEEAVSSALVLPSCFLLHVGNGLWYKNREGVLKIYAALLARNEDAPELVMMGDVQGNSERDLVRQLGIEERVHWMAQPPTAWIKVAYEQAQALIFPSLEEGFGWPVLEAMACGCPVFASDRAPLSEIGGDAVDYIDPMNPTEAAEIVDTCLRRGAEWQRQRSAAGRARAAHFSVDRFARELTAVYQSVFCRQNSATEVSNS